MSSERAILERYRTIVVVGASSIETKPSHRVSQYMLSQGYTVVPVNPDEAEVFGVPCYPDLASVPGPVEFVNVFRRPQYCTEVVQEAIAVGATVVWLQAGIVSEEARALAESAGLTFVQNRCVLQEHPRHQIGRVGVQSVQTPEPERHEGAITEPIEGEPLHEPLVREQPPSNPADGRSREESEEHEGAITEPDEGAVRRPAAPL